MGPRQAPGQDPIRKSERLQKKDLIRKSERLRKKISVSRFLEVKGELVHIKELRCRKRHLCGIDKKGVVNHDDHCYGKCDIIDDDDDEDEETNHSENDHAFKKGSHDKDWVPKFQRKKQVVSYTDVANVDHDAYITDNHFTSNTEVNNKLCYLLDDNNHRYKAAYACEYNNTDMQYVKIHTAGQPITVTYVRRKRRRKVPGLRSWMNKKCRTFCGEKHREKKLLAAAIQHENDSLNAHAFSKLAKAVEVSTLPESIPMPQSHQGPQSPSTTLLPLQASSPPVFLTTVLECLPEELVDFEPTKSSHEAQSAHISLSLTENGTERFPQQLGKWGIEKKKTEGPAELTEKLKQKKHRPKVCRNIFDKEKCRQRRVKTKPAEFLCDIYGKAKRKPKKREKKPAEQGKDGLLKDEQTVLPMKRRAKKGQGTVKVKKQCGRQQGTALVTQSRTVLKDSNLSTTGLCTSGEGNSLVPSRCTDWMGISDQSKKEVSLPMLTMSGDYYAQGLFIAPFCPKEEPCKEDLSISTYLAEGHVRLSPELARFMQGYMIAFPTHRKQLVPLIYAMNWPLCFKFTNEATWSTSDYSSIHSRPERSTMLSLTQAPYNQLQLVTYDQRRELTTSKSTRLPSKIRAKVQLDAENERIWPLLALGGIPETFEDILYWQRERALMKRRVELFICTMQSIQGDRHFSPWKGSVLDSLVGAFLTQNVSDHLSSSAFMSIAARYPSKQGNGLERTNIYETNGTVNAKTTCALEANGIPCGMQRETENINEEHSSMHRASNLANVTGQEGMHLTDTMGNNSEGTNTCKTNGTVQNTNVSKNEEHLYMQGDPNLPKVGNQGCMRSTARMAVQCMKNSNDFTSVRAIKKLLRKIDTTHTKNTEISKTSTSPIKFLRGEGSHFEDDIQSNQVSIRENPSEGPHESSISSICEHKKLTVNFKMQNGMQHTEGSSPHLTEAKSLTEQCDISLSGLDYHNSTTISTKLKEISTSNAIDSTSVSMHYPENVSICSMEESTSTIHSVVSNSGCNHESLASPLITRELLALNDLSQLLQKVRMLLNETHSPEQSSSKEGSPDRRTEVYHKLAVCRSLFKDDICEEVSFKANTSLDSHNEWQTRPASDTNVHTDANPYFSQASKEMRCESDVNPSTDVPSISKILGAKRYHPLGGIERAHLEENQNGRKRNQTQDWEALRKFTLQRSHISGENTDEENSKVVDYQDAVNWDAVRCASVEEVALTIKERGMHHVLSGRIKAFLKTLYEEQGNLDLEWLRKVSPEDSKAYLTGIRGLGVKSVECIRLLTLHHVAFPVDVNVGRICVRLGWVPIEPLPGQLQLHLLELYPFQETIQKYLWPRLCALDQKTLYELHYQLITFGKVFCTKQKPNCNACPMRTECKHFASAYASAKLLLTGPNDDQPKRLRTSTQIHALTHTMKSMEEVLMNDVPYTYPSISEVDCNSTDSYSTSHEYLIEEPASPQSDIGDIEDFPRDYGSLNDLSDDLLRAKSFPETPYASNDYSCKDDSNKCEIQSYSANAGNEDCCHNNIGGQFDSQEANFETLIESPSYSGNQSKDNPSEGLSLSHELKVCRDTFNVSKAIITLAEGAYIPAPKLKQVDRLRTIHYVYELPDTHPLLKQADVREKDDPSSYLLAIWSPGEAPSSLQEVDEADLNKLSSTNPNEVVSGTLLIPCKTAMRGKFPLNGTYFQVNEVFADHASSLQPFQVPRAHVWSLQRRFVYFGTSVSAIFRGLTSDEIKVCFLRGHVCVRGFDREKRVPRPLVCALHFPISKQIHRPKKHDQEAPSQDKEEETSDKKFEPEA